MEKQQNTIRYSDDRVIIYLADNNITDLSKFVIRDEADGNGPYIAKWDYPIEQPSDEILECTDNDYIKERVKSIREPGLYFNNPKFVAWLFPDIEKKYQDFLAACNKQ